MNRTIKDATVKRYHYETHDELQEYLTLFLAAYNSPSRKQLHKGITRQKGKLTMCQRELPRKHWHQLDTEQQKQLAKWFELQPKLKLASDIKESFFAIWYSSSIDSDRE